MAYLSDFFPMVLSSAPACPDPTAEQWIRQAAIEFCTRTRVWRETDEFEADGHPIEVVAVPANAALHEIEAAWFNGHELEAARYKTVGTLSGGTPRYLTQIGPDRFNLTPPEAGTFRVNMFLKPSREADELPDFLLEHYEQTIADGALARILSLPEQGWTNPQLAAAHRQSFDADVNRLSASNIRGQQRAPVRSRSQFF